MMFALPAILCQSSFDPNRPFYCPQNTTGFYSINYTVTPQVTLANYCPQDTTGFYSINYTVTPQVTLANYCPQDATGFYDFSTPP